MELKLTLVFEWLRHALRRISFKSHRDTSKERLRIRLLVRVNPSGETKKVDILGGGSAFGAPPHLPSGEMSAHSKGFFSSLFGGSLKKGKGDKAACSYPALKSVGLAAPETVVDGEGDSKVMTSHLGSSNQTATWPLMFQQLCRKASEAPEAPVPEVSANNQKKKGARSALSVISFQKASGPRDLTDQLVSLCDASRSDLIKACPKEIAADTPGGGLMWATALALVLLIGNYSDQIDEWEMIAEKGTKCLVKNLRGSLTLDQVVESAAAVVEVPVLSGL